MPLDNYDNLKAAVIRADGSDDINDVIDDAIDTAESYMFANEIEPLLVRGVETRTNLVMSTSSRFLALPAYFLEMRRIKYVEDGDDKEIKFRTPSVIQESDVSGQPQYFTVTSQLEFERIPDQAYTVEAQFYAKIVPLDDTNTTNEVLTNHPQIYMHGCLWYINSTVNGEQQIAEYHRAQFLQAIIGANKEYSKGRFGPTPVRRSISARRVY
jgi:hypothetical protein